MEQRARPKHFSMIRGFHLADVFTLGNAACGVAGVLMAMRYLVSEDVTYEKVWLELQALAWNDAGLRARLARVNAEWRAVLTDAFREPHRELGIDMPLEALVSLVITFNEGIIFERLSGIETGQAELLQWIDDWLERSDKR